MNFLLTLQKETKKNNQKKTAFSSTFSTMVSSAPNLNPSIKPIVYWRGERPRGRSQTLPGGRNLRIVDPRSR